MVHVPDSRRVVPNPEVNRHQCTEGRHTHYPTALRGCCPASPHRPCLQSRTGRPSSPCAGPTCRNSARYFSGSLFSHSTLISLFQDRGLKANMKTEALIDLLIETSKPNTSAPAHTRSSSLRVVSRPGSSSAIRNRIGSMIIHDVDDDAEQEGTEDVEMGDVVTNGTVPPRTQIPGPATRAREAGAPPAKIGL